METPKMWERKNRRGGGKEGGGREEGRESMATVTVDILRAPVGLIIVMHMRRLYRHKQIEVGD